MTALLPLLIAFWQFGGTSATPTATSLGLVIGTDVQAYDATLASYAAQNGAANKIAYFNGANDITTTDFSAAARTLVACETAVCQREAMSLADGTASLNVGAASVNGEFTAYAGVTWYANTIATGASPYAVQAIDYWIFCDTAGGVVELDLLEPGVTAFVGKSLCVKKMDAGGNTCTLDTPGAHTIDGAATYVLNTAYEYVCIASSGSNWFVTNAGP